jgi:acetyltransferase-like isoleucine patch superfamily enzyme
MEKVRKKGKHSLAFDFLKKLGLNFSEDEYGKVSFVKMIKAALKHVRNTFLLKYCMYSILLSPINYRKIRPILWRWMGAKVGKDCFIGYEVWVDMTNTHLIEIEDHVHITNRCLLLCHQRDLSNYYVGDDYTKLNYNKKKITLKKGCSIGMGSIILPGVTIGEGAVVGAGSLVTKDIPAWTIATGRPAKVVKKIPQR